MLKIIILNQLQKKLQHYEFLTDARLRNQEKPFQNRSADWAEKALNHQPIMLLIFNNLKKLLTTMHTDEHLEKIQPSTPLVSILHKLGKEFSITPLNYIETT